MLLLSMLTLAALLVQDCSAQTASPVVTTRLGQVVGNRKQDESGNTYDEYLGMPFAAPPVGSLRWQIPQPASLWEGVRNATEFSAHCVHVVAAFYDDISNVTSEDCLYLNVWVPGGVAERPARPVMVYFYGGAFLLGSGAQYPGYELGHNADVIVVTFNYRLSSIGWISTEDDNLPGNYGLWDGRAALTWVKENIAAFGGDANRVTIFGQSAGGAMVSHTLASLQTRDLFKSGIYFSGGATGLVGTNRRARQMAEILADWLGCPIDNTAAMVACLREQSAEDLDEGALAAPVLEGLSPRWNPVIDGTFVHQHPVDSFTEGIPKVYDIITGTTYHDSAGFVLLNLFGHNNTDYGNAETKEDVDDFFRGYLANFISRDFVNETLDLVKERYPDLESDDLVTRAMAATQAHTDLTFASPASLETSLHSSSPGGQGKTYSYNFRYRQSFQMYPDWVNGSHTDDVFSWIGTTFLRGMRQTELNGEYSTVDLRMRDTLQTICHNMAYNGDPNVGRPFPVSWPEYNEQSRQFARLSAFMNPSSIEGETADQVSRYDFWINLMADDSIAPRNQHVGMYDRYEPDDLIEAADKILPGVVPDYFQYRETLLDILVDAFYRARVRREVNRKKWGTYATY